MSAPRVDFYVIGESEPRARAKFACQLVEKAFSLGHRVHLHCADASEAATIDTLLWTFRDRAFVPHELGTGAEPHPEVPVVVGHAEPSPAPRQVLVNLAATVPDWFASFERVAEVVSEDPTDKAAGRERFKFYRDHGCTPETHKMGAER